jgi:hypothetical protein
MFPSKGRDEKMRFIPTKAHGILDYLVGALLIAAPWLLGFSRGGAETFVPVILGAGLIIYSIFTDYEMGLVRSIPMSTHLTLDVLGGIVLAVSPWLFNFNDIVTTPHVVVGLLEMGMGLTTYMVPAGCRTC